MTPTVPAVTEEIVPVGGRDVRPDHMAALGARERDVRRLVAPGRSDADIVGCIVLGPGTVATHLHHFCGKINATGFDWATRFAREHRLG